jgi:hypothetical protein
MREKDSVFLFRSALWHKLLVLSAILSLVISVATRFSVVEQQNTSTTIVRSQSLDASRQHLLNDSLHWSTPSATFVLFVPAKVSLAAWSAVASVVRLHSESLLYSRPPPFSCASRLVSQVESQMLPRLRCPQPIS